MPVVPEERRGWAAWIYGEVIVRLIMRDVTEDWLQLLPKRQRICAPETTVAISGEKEDKKVQRKCVMSFGSDSAQLIRIPDPEWRIQSCHCPVVPLCEERSA